MVEALNFLIGLLLAFFFYSGTLYWLQSCNLKWWVEFVIGVVAVVILLTIAGPIYT